MPRVATAFWSVKTLVTVATTRGNTQSRILYNYYNYILQAHMINYYAQPFIYKHCSKSSKFLLFLLVRHHLHKRGKSEHQYSHKIIGYINKVYVCA